MKRPDKIKMLIVEDDRLIGRMIKDFFEMEGESYVFLAAESGLEAFDLCLKEKPDVIITDLMLPGMDGIQLIRQLRELSDFAVTPIVACTAGGPTMESDAMDAGAHMVLAKPIDQKALVSAVDSLLKVSPFLKPPLLAAGPAEAWKPRSISEGIPSLKKLFGWEPGDGSGSGEKS